MVHLRHGQKEHQGKRQKRRRETRHATPQGRVKVVRASDLAQMGVCEQRVVFETIHGQRQTAQECRVMLRGRQMHEQYHREGLELMQKHSPSFIWWIVKALISWLVSAWRGRAGRETKDNRSAQGKDGC